MFAAERGVAKPTASFFSSLASALRGVAIIRAACTPAAITPAAITPAAIIRAATSRARGRPGARGTVSAAGISASLTRAGAILGLVSLLSASVLGTGCAGATFDGQLFRKDEVAFRLAHVPPSWRQIEINDTALAFRDDQRETTVAINGRCGQDAEDVPLQSLTHHLFLQFTERQIELQRLIPLDGREALETQMVAKLDGVVKYFHVVVLKKDGCVYDFLQIASERQDADSFRQFVSGFSSAS